MCLEVPRGKRVREKLIGVVKGVVDWATLEKTLPRKSRPFFLKLFGCVVVPVGTPICSTTNHVADVARTGEPESVVRLMRYWSVVLVTWTGKVKLMVGLRVWVVFHVMTFETTALLRVTEKTLAPVVERVPRML